jgi:hypothetical protein
VSIWSLAATTHPKAPVGFLVTLFLIAAVSIGVGVGLWRDPYGPDRVGLGWLMGYPPQYYHRGARRINAAFLILFGLLFILGGILSLIFEYLLD